jgi:hypothetical protein
MSASKKVCKGRRFSGAKYMMGERELLAGKGRGMENLRDIDCLDFWPLSP